MVALLSDSSPLVESIHLAFSVYDRDDNGVLDWTELTALVRDAMTTNAVVLTNPELQELTRHTMLTHGIDKEAAAAYLVGKAQERKGQPSALSKTALVLPMHETRN